MDIPYLCLSRLGQSSIFCAAKGTSIHTFDLKDDGYSFVSSWTHPLAKQTENGKIVEEAAQGGEPLDEQEETDQPPSKKRKLDSDEKPNVKKEANQDDTRVAEGPANGNEKKKKPQRPELRSQRTELPFVVLLTATEDGNHVVAVTSQDKTLWVFEHDGKGTLTKLSQRYVDFTATILSLSSDHRQSHAKASKLHQHHHGRGYNPICRQIRGRLFSPLASNKNGRGGRTKCSRSPCYP